MRIGVVAARPTMESAIFYGQHAHMFPICTDATKMRLVHTSAAVIVWTSCEWMRSVHTDAAVTVDDFL
jgi:hypothetical protein